MLHSTFAHPSRLLIAMMSAVLVHACTPAAPATSPATDADAGMVAVDDDGVPAAPGPSPRHSTLCQYDDDVSVFSDVYWDEGRHRPKKTSMTFVDASRSVPATDHSEQRDARELDVVVHYPAADGWTLDVELADGGPFPLIVYSHGFSSSNAEADNFGAFLASHGYIVAAPSFPLSKMSANGFRPEVLDVGNQPGDVAFVIDQMLAKSQLSSDPFAGAVDDDRIGVTGVSLGGLTSLLVAHHRSLHDPRVRAAAPMAAPASFLTRTFYDHRDVPLLLMHGDRDAFVNYDDNARVAWRNASPYARLLTVVDGSHTGFGLPIDGWAVDLAQWFSDDDDAHPRNPDGLGCGFIGDQLADVDDSMFDALGGADDGVVVTDADRAALPCAGDEVTRPALDATTHGRLARTALLAFFNAHLASSSVAQQEACRFLVENLAAHDDLVLE